MIYGMKWHGVLVAISNFPQDIDLILFVTDKYTTLINCEKVEINNYKSIEHLLHDAGGVE